jgi:GT2 family glycosyltransferase
VRAGGVAVVVPTRDRPETLRRCLDALGAQTRRPDEVVVVDDGSADGGAVAAVAAGREGVRVVRGAGRGPAAARNAGVAAASAPLVLLTDDDCLPAPSWVERLARPLEAGAGAAAGAVVNGLDRSALARAAQVVAEAFRRPAADGSSLEFAPSSNLGCTRELLLELPFDERFREAAGEDREWCARLRERGVALLDAPEAVVTHLHEQSLREFVRQQAAYGRGAHRYRTRRGARLEPRRFYLGLARQAFSDGPATGAAFLLAQVATAAGYAGEALRRRRSGAPEELADVGEQAERD